MCPASGSIWLRRNGRWRCPHLSRMDHRGQTPTDRLAGIAAAMLEAAEAHPEHRGSDRVIAMLDDDVESAG